MLGKFHQKKSKKDYFGMTKDDAIQVASKLAKIEGDKYSGWKEFVLLLDDYIKTVSKNKMAIDFNNMTDSELKQLKLFDRDIWLIENIIKPLPLNFVKGLEASLKEEREKDYADNDNGS